jgi:hypothetical protein
MSAIGASRRVRRPVRHLFGRAVLLTFASVATWLAGPAACRSTRPELPAREQRPVFEELPAPSWRIVARREGKVLLAAQRVIVRGIRRQVDPRREAVAERALEYPTLIFENGRLRNGPVARATVLVLLHGGRPDTLRLYSLEFEGRPVLFAQAGEGPHPHESPAEPGHYVVERNDRVWLVAPTGVTQLTADTTPGIARDTLQSQQREGLRHLFWAAGPLWSPGGSALAYVTNRTWMLDRSGGQEVWLAELRPRRRERPLLSERGEFFSPRGWLGSELVYAPREGPISAIDLRTGARRAIAVGAVVVNSPDGSRLLYMSSAGGTVRGHVLRADGAVNIPDPSPGERLDYAGVFSPRGKRLVLGTTFARDSGITRALYVFDLAAERLTPLLRWSFREGTRHPHGLPAWLDDSTLLLTQFDRSTGLESSTLVRTK